MSNLNDSLMVTNTSPKPFRAHLVSGGTVLHKCAFSLLIVKQRTLIKIKYTVITDQNGETRVYTVTLLDMIYKSCINFNLPISLVSLQARET